MFRAILRSIARLTMYRPKGFELIVLAAEPGRESGKQMEVPIFINPKALTFPVLVGLVKGAWASASLLQVSWATSVFLPLIICLLLGILIAVANLLEQNLRFIDWIIGVAIGLLNSLVVFGAVMGISRSGN
jgi:hypothetical protein